MRHLSRSSSLRFVPLATLVFACAPETDPACACDTGGEVWGQAALDFLEERLVGTFAGQWLLYGLDENDAPTPSYTWVDTIAGSNPRIEGDRALVDIVDDMDGGTWSQSIEFNEGVYVTEDGGVGDYFIDLDGEITIVTEVEPDHWEYTAELEDYDFSALANVTEDNFVEGWKTSTKVVDAVEGWERHDVSTLTHVVYTDASGAEQEVDFISLEGYHQKYQTYE